MSQKSRAHNIVTIFGGLGYISCLVQWLWSLTLLMPAILQNDIIRDFLAPHHSDKTVQAFQYSPPPLLAIIIGAVVTAIVLIVSIILIIRLPGTVSRKSGQIVSQSADRAVSIKIRKHQVPAAKKRRLRARYIELIKLCMTVMPLILLIVTLFVDVPLEPTLVFVIGIFIACWTLLWFGLQYLFARLLHVPMDHIS